MKTRILGLFALIVFFYAGCTDSESEVDGAVSTVGSYSTMLTIGHRLYVVSDQSITTFDITDVRSPKKINHQNIGTDIESLLYHEGNLFIGSERNMYIYTLDIQGIPQRTSVASYSELFTFSCRSSDPIVIVDQYAYVTLSTRIAACPNQGVNSLIIYDIKDIKKPNFITTLAMAEPKGLAAKGDYLFICDAQTGIEVMDISDRTTPLRVKTIPLPKAYDLIIKNNLMMVVTDKSVHQYDISDIKNIVSLSKIKIKD